MKVGVMKYKMKIPVLCCFATCLLLFACTNVEPEHDENYYSTDYKDISDEYYPLYKHERILRKEDQTKGVYKPFSTDNVVPYDYGDNDAYFLEYDACFY